MTQPIPPSSHLPPAVALESIRTTPSASLPNDSGEVSNSPWAKMFPSGATKEELKMFISIFIRDMITQIKHDDDRWKEAMKRQKESYNS